MLSNTEELGKVFVTHLNYLECLADATSGLQVTCLRPPRARARKDPSLESKARLAKLTYKSLKSERKTISEDPEYAEACVVWVAAKAYYLTYYLWTVILHLKNMDQGILTGNHSTVLNRIDEELESGRLVFNKIFMNEVCLCKDIAEFRVPPGANLSNVFYDLDTRIKQIRKKLNEYKLAESKRRKNIKDFRTREGRRLRDAYYSNSRMSINQFFYWYRIKANYRDVSYLEASLSSDDFNRYFLKYFELTENYVKAQIRLANEFANIRFGHDIIVVR